VLDGVELPLRANLGTTPSRFSFIGLPVVAVPVPLQPLPIRVGRRRALALRIAHALKQAGTFAVA
jgi:hypothetical protein